MIIQESKLVKKDSPACSEYANYEWVTGYFLTIDDLHKLVRDFQVDCHDGFVSNDNSYIEEWLKKHNQIVKAKNWNEEFKKIDEHINKTTLEPPEGFNFVANSSDDD